MNDTNRGQLAIDLVNQSVDASMAARKAQYESAKTNTERLMVAGVIVTCDDAQDNAMRWQYCSDIAKEAGVNSCLVSAASDFSRIYDSIVDQLKYIVSQNETPEEFGARVSAAAAKVEGKREGAKRTCKHNTTKKDTGLMRVQRTSDGIEYVCCRCGARFVVSAQATEPTPAAEAAFTTLKTLK